MRPQLALLEYNLGQVRIMLSFFLIGLTIFSSDSVFMGVVMASSNHHAGSNIFVIGHICPIAGSHCICSAEFFHLRINEATVGSICFHFFS